MKTRKLLLVVLLASGATSVRPTSCQAQCCLNDLFAGCSSCFRKAPQPFAAAPIMAPPMMPAPIMAPIPAGPQPVVVPVQQVSYVPETTYRTQYECVPVTSYKPSSEIDPCTGCPRECSEQVTNYVQRAVNVPFTQYRAVYSTKYVQMQPGYNAAAPGAPIVGPGSAGVAASPFAAPVQSSPQAWGAAGADVPQQLIPGQQAIAAPALPPAGMPQQTFQQQIVPQSGTYATPVPANQPQPTLPPALAPAPSLKPIPELPRTVPSGNASAAGSASLAKPFPSVSPAPSVPLQPVPSGVQSPTGESGGNTMPILPGAGPGTSTGAFPKLLEPTGHTTSWQPARSFDQSPTRIAITPVSYPSAYPTAALPTRGQQ